MQLYHFLLKIPVLFGFTGMMLHPCSDRCGGTQVQLLEDRMTFHSTAATSLFEKRMSDKTARQRMKRTAERCS